MINLTNITLETAQMIRKWAGDKYYEEFFRRHPPVFAWGDDQNIVTAFSTSYFIRDDDQIVGLMSLANYDTQHKMVEMGLLIDKEYKKDNLKAYTSACVQAADYVFNYLGYNKMYTKVLTHRGKLRSNMDKAGFTRNGTLPQNVFWKGEFHDEDVYSILARDFKENY